MAMGTPRTATPDDAGLRERLQAYLQAQCGRPVRVGALKRFPVGFSWVTIGFTATGVEEDEETKLILRLGPDYGLFAPYSALPQALSMQSLEGSGVPVPKVYWCGDDPSILGAPFLITDRARGAAVIPWAGTKPLEDGLRLALADQFIDALAGIHRLDWQERPIARLAGNVTPASAARREVDSWEERYRAWAQRPFPMFEWGAKWLRAHCPEAPRVSIVHGDYRTGNFLAEGPRITAILDWELAHLGDPHEDLGWASLPMYMAGTKLVSKLIAPESFYEKYGAKVGFEVSQRSVRFYQAFSLLKLAATHMAAARCFENGRLDDMRMPAMGTQIHTCLRQLERTIEAMP
jgi:aminoglycoside phosphotransferase (APT) family kinase protein